jgi:cation:H+ antiporter
MANMAILAVADLLVRHTRVLTQVAVNQSAVGALAICLAAIATLGMLVPGRMLVGVGWATAAVAATYVAGMRYLHRNRAEPPFGPPEHAARPRRTELRRAVVGFVIGAIVILAAAPYLASSTASLADRLGVSRGFAGMLLLAVTTSLPEAVVTVTSVRAGTYDLAVGNLLGSNCFNMLVLVPLDVVDGGRSLLADTGRALSIGALAGMLLTGLAILGILDRAERRRRMIDLGPIVMIGVYVATLVVSAGMHE